MFSHMMVGSNDIARSKTFYDATFAAMGGKPAIDRRQGPADLPAQWRHLHRHQADRRRAGDLRQWLHDRLRHELRSRPTPGTQAGVANGGTAIEDPPGVREGGFGKLYLAYLRDPDGNKLCALHRIA